MSKETTFLSAVHLKKKSMKKRNSKRKQLFNKVLDYLKSDTFMFAPLYSSHFSTVESSSSVPTRIEEDKPLEGNDKKFISKICEYLKADTYMYAPLVISRTRDSAATPTETVHISKGPVPTQEERERKRSADAPKGGIGKVDKAGRKTVNVVGKDHNMDGFPHTRSRMVTRIRRHRETVKHMIYQNR
ncbi:hypothetical protein HAX54_036310 [Datura stramonium]|uniref:Uncharacterized protein n=1 Tax=Datura stramonium TaxID=4076 RepID=A0ABS8RME0_DATST|nr:hypothetical protein [Datura stramonium]